MFEPQVMMITTGLQEGVYVDGPNARGCGLSTMTQFGVPFHTWRRLRKEAGRSVSGVAGLGWEQPLPRVTCLDFLLPLPCARQPFRTPDGRNVHLLPYCVIRGGVLTQASTTALINPSPDLKSTALQYKTCAASVLYSVGTTSCSL